MGDGGDADGGRGSGHRVRRGRVERGRTDLERVERARTAYEVRTRVVRARADPDHVVVVETADVEEMCGVLGGHFGTHQVRIVGDGPLKGRYAAAHRSPVTAVEIAYGTGVEVCVPELPDFYNVHIPLSGVSRVVVDHQPVEAADSVVGPGQRLALLCSGDAQVLVLNFRADAVREALALRLGDRLDDELRFDGRIGVGSEAARAWVDLACAFADAARAGLLDQSLVASRQFERVLIDSLLDTQPHSYSADLARDGTPAAPAAVRRAMRFCEEHAGEPVSLADIARAANVGARALQKGFRRHLGVTPLQYLRKVRLRRVHEELVAATWSPAGGTVTDILLRWGFAHPSRFAYFYRQVYGVSPSQTLRAVRRTDPAAD